MIMEMPVLPQRPDARPSSLKATTRAMLAGHGLRRRAEVPAQSFTVTLTEYAPTLHGGTFLLYLYQAALMCQEHIRVFGPAARTLETFVQVYRLAEIVVIHEPQMDWSQHEHWLGVGWLDDADFPARARVHHFCRPEYRTREVTTKLATLTLQYWFEHKGYSFLYGLTPTENRAAIRFAKRMGFSPVGTKPMMHNDQLTIGLETALPRERWAALRTLEE